MPSRRTMELVVITVVLMQPVFALAKIWATKTLGSTQPGSVAHGTAEIVNLVS